MNRWPALLFLALFIPFASAQAPDLYVHSGGPFAAGDVVELLYGNEGTSQATGSLLLVVRHQDDSSDDPPRFSYTEDNAVLSPGDENKVAWAVPADAPQGSYLATLSIGDATAVHVLTLGPQPTQNTSPAPPAQPRNTHPLEGTRQDHSGNLYVQGDATLGFQQSGNFYKGDHARFTYFNGVLTDLKVYGDARDPLLLSRLAISPAPFGQPHLQGPAFVHTTDTTGLEVHDHPQAFINIDLSDGAAASLEAPLGAAWSQVTPRTFVLRGGELDATLSIIDLVTTEWTNPDGASGGGRQDRVVTGPPRASIQVGQTLQVSANGDLTLAISWGSSDDDAIALAEHVSTGFLSSRIIVGSTSATMFPYAYMQTTAYQQDHAWVFDLGPRERPIGMMALTVKTEIANPALDEGVQVLVDGKVVGDAGSLNELVAAYHRGERGFWIHQVGDQYEVVYADPSNEGQQLRLQAYATEPVQSWIAGRTVGLAIGAGAAILLAIVSLTRSDRF